MTPVFGITGWKNSGKTTLVSSLVREFSRRGFTVSTIKNAHHDFQIDVPGTDSFSHREAGAHEVAIVSEKRWALMHEIKSAGEKPSLNSMISKLAPCDLILVEGFKASPIDKIECIRVGTAKEEPLWPSNRKIVAVASDQPIQGCTKPLFDLNNIQAITDFIIQRSGVGE